MKISIITCSCNSSSHIGSAIESVLAQDYPHIEYIIIDGGSTDTTVSIIEQHESSLAHWVSEKDNGIYDAINKGIAMAKGDFVGLLHSDDFFAHNSVVSNIAIALQTSGADALYGDLEYVKQNDTTQRHRLWRAGQYKKGLFLKGWMPPHPTFYARRTLFKKLGHYCTDFRISADYELLLRFIHKYQVKLTYLPEVLVKMRTGGKSNISLKNRLLANREDRRAWKVNGLNPALFTTIRKPLSKLGQFLEK